MLNDGVGMSINRRVDPYAEDVLVVLCEGTWAHHVSEIGCLARVNVHNAHDTRCSDFDRNTSGLIQFELIELDKAKSWVFPNMRALTLKTYS